jgi:hypothetical protein
MRNIGCLPQSLPAINHILSLLFHGACQIGYASTILIVLQTHDDFGLWQVLCEQKRTTKDGNYAYSFPFSKLSLNTFNLTLCGGEKGEEAVILSRIFVLIWKKELSRSACPQLYSNNKNNRNSNRNNCAVRTQLAFTRHNACQLLC